MSSGFSVAGSFISASAVPHCRLVILYLMQRSDQVEKQSFVKLVKTSISVRDTSLSVFGTSESVWIFTPGQAVAVVLGRSVFWRKGWWGNESVLTVFEGL